MKILLTGINGFLGTSICRELLELHEIYGLSRTKSDYNFHLDKVIPEFNTRFDLVIHAAGKAHVFTKTNIDEQLFYEVNVLGTLNLLEALINSGIPKYFVFISSVSVYGLNRGRGINENTKLGATDPYGLSKIKAEKIICEWCEKNNVICTILRLPLLVGANPPGNLESMIQAIKKGYYFNVDGGKAKKSMILVEDVAKNIINISRLGGIFNLTDGMHPTISEFSTFIALCLGKKRPHNLPLWFAKLLARIGDMFGKSSVFNTSKLIKVTSELTFDDSKARESFGWEPSPVLNRLKFICFS
jgi:nucleoside-diphosphate-sugar epimerase